MGWVKAGYLGDWYDETRVTLRAVSPCPSRQSLQAFPQDIQVPFRVRYGHETRLGFLAAGRREIDRGTRYIETGYFLPG